MKKALIFLIALVLLVTAGIFAVSAENQAESGAVWCDRCRKNVPANEWMEWTTTGGDFTEEGHFYLADTFTEQETTVNILALKFVCLDLRGNTWATEGIQTMSISGDFSIMDSVGGGLILTTGTNKTAGAFADVCTAGALNLYSGTIQRIVRDNITLHRGGLINITDGTFNVYGGTVSGGVAKGFKDNGTTYTPRGGNIYMTNTQANLTVKNGGKITGSNNLAQSHGNAAIQAKGKLIINGGEVNSNPKIAVGLYGGEGIEFNGGVVNVTAPWYGVTTGTKQAGTPIVFNGGTVTIMAERAFYSYSVPVVQIGDKVKAYGGSGKRNAEEYTGTDKKLLSKPWFFVTDNPDLFIEVEEEEEDTAMDYQTAMCGTGISSSYIYA